jgi:nucleotide-binding universal stress UspA family protein
MTIIAAVDRSDRAATVVSEAERLAEAFDEPVHVVHVLTRSEFLDLGRTSVESGDSIDMDEVRSVAKSIASETAEDLDVPHESAGLMGAPADRITTYAEENDARYIVVSGRKRSPTGKALFGSVTQSILLNARCPVVSAIRQSTA